MLRQGSHFWHRMVLAPLAILALAVQCLVVQTHVDIAPARVDAAASVSTPHHSAPRDDNATAACAICQAALTGAMVLGAAPTPVVAALEGHIATDVARYAVIAVRPSHAWRSRAPPLV